MSKLPSRGGLLLMLIVVIVVTIQILTTKFGPLELPFQIWVPMSAFFASLFVATFICWWSDRYCWARDRQELELCHEELMAWRISAIEIFCKDNIGEQQRFVDEVLTRMANVVARYEREQNNLYTNGLGAQVDGKLEDAYRRRECDIKKGLADAMERFDQTHKAFRKTLGDYTSIKLRSDHWRAYTSGPK